MKKTFLAVSVILMSIACQQKAKKTADDINKDIKEIVDKTPGVNAGSGTYSIKAIDGWEKVDTTFAGMKTTIVKSKSEGPDDKFIENVTVVTQQADNYDAEKYFKDNLTQMEAQMPGFKKQEDGAVTINGEKGYHMVYSHSYTGTPIDADAYFFVKDNIAYVITCSAPKGKLTEWKPSFEKVVNTFTIN